MPVDAFADVSKTANVTEVSTSEAPVQSTELRQHVTFPNHFQVPEALKGGLTFGSFDTFDPSEKSSSVTGCDNSTSPTPESSSVNAETVNSRFVIYMILMYVLFFAWQIRDFFVPSHLLNGV
jgi:hypothetical protein